MLVDDFEGAPSHVSIALVRTFQVVVAQPAIRVFLERLHGFIEDCAERLPKELVQHGPVEALDTYVCSQLLIRVLQCSISFNSRHSS